VYKLADGMVERLSPDFILTAIAPGIVKLFGAGVARVLGLALLWAGITPRNNQKPLLMPLAMHTRILAAVRVRLELGPGAPLPSVVVRVPIIVGGAGGQVEFSQLPGVGEESGVGSGGHGAMQLGSAGLSSSEIARQLAAQTALTCSLKRRMEETHAELLAAVSAVQENLTAAVSQVNSNIRRIRVAPVVHGVAANVVGSGGVASSTANLSERPRNLHLLWEEWEHGSGVNKAARSFSPEERGRCKGVYSLRKCFWSVIDSMVRKGWTADAAIDRVYVAYGQGTPVTKILHMMRNDKKLSGGVHASLL